jgi:hypothetical protein
MSEPDINEATSTTEEQARMRIVKCTTRFTTLMSLTIALVTLPLYIITKAAVVRTILLDAIGDFMTSCVTLYTGHRMNKLEPKRYPVGQTKFQSIGCLVFSTFMFAFFFGNAVENIKELVESRDDVGHLAISRFFYQAGEGLGGNFAMWRDEVEETDTGYEWDAHGENISNPLKVYFSAGTSREREMAARMDDKVNRRDIVKAAAEYENMAEVKEELIKQNFVLAFIATSKVALWLYCVMH